MPARYLAEFGGIQADLMVNLCSYAAAYGTYQPATADVLIGPHRIYAPQMLQVWFAAAPTLPLHLCTRVWPGS